MCFHSAARNVQVSAAHNNTDKKRTWYSWIFASRQRTPSGRIWHQRPITNANATWLIQHFTFEQLLPPVVSSLPRWINLCQWIWRCCQQVKTATTLWLFVNKLDILNCQILHLTTLQCQLVLYIKHNQSVNNTDRPVMKASVFTFMSFSTKTILSVNLICWWTYSRQWTR